MWGIPEAISKVVLRLCSYGGVVTMISSTTRVAVFAIAITMPGALHAQRGGGGGPGTGGGSNPIAPLIDMRRELNLSARQLVQLDSLERGLIQRNQVLRERLRSRLDSVRPRASYELAVADHGNRGSLAMPAIQLRCCTSRPRKS